ncbi:MAG: hypothetical protein A3A88_09360 [Nitrospirae bacterium RIFCSPLOWO2_01_FULL_62_17]|nr:MAG: hypothetical protein A3A88_09360 [Nitrospirae bacterium RIFCSPLOWO2_01_FULL_62_17]
MFSLSDRQTATGSPTAGMWLLAVGVAALWLAGCGGKGESVSVDLRAAAPSAPAKSSSELTVAVTDFDDSGLQKGRLGSRSHLWGGTSYFDLSGGKPGEVVAQLVAENLKKRGWHVEKAGADGKAQVTLSGKVLELSVNAKSSFGSTDITSATKIALEAVNAADGSKVRMTLSGAGSQGVFWFEEEDAQALLSETIAESLEKLIATTKVENNLLRLK